MRTSNVLCFTLIFLFLVVFSGCSQEKPAEEKEISRPVKYFEINPANQGANLEYSGKITAVQDVDMSFEVSGKINIFPVKEGQRVQKDAILARLDPRDFQIALDSQKADLNAAGAEYERARGLYENDTISKRDLDVARRNYEVAEAGVRSARKTLNDTKLVAPFSGLVAKTLVENYQNIQAKQPILILQDDSSLEMVVDIPESDYAKIGKDVTLAELTQALKPEIIVASVPGKKFAATFKEAASTADPTTRTFEVTLGFEAPSDISILSGMTARLLITRLMKKDGSFITVPVKAVLSDENKQATVWLIDPSSNRVKRHPIEIGEMTGDEIIVTKGLKSGDIIAGSGAHQLREDMLVRKYEKP